MEIAQLNEEKESGEMNDSTYRTELHKWLAKIGRLGEDHGADNVPLDIRYAVNNVQENLGVEKTVYPHADGRYVRFCDFQTYYSHMANSSYAGCSHP